jgi:hypothetical protein
MSSPTTSPSLSALNILVPQSQPSLAGVRIRLPWSWPGYVLGAVSFLSAIFNFIAPDDPEVNAVALFTQGLVMVYYLYCVYRLHKVLAIATQKRYPTSPVKAVLFSFIPLYSIVWAVKWPNQMSRFLREEKPDLVIARRWPGIVSLIAMLLGPVGLSGIFLFAVISYLKLKMRRVIRFETPAPLFPKERLDFAISGGLGAGFGLLLCQAVQDFMDKHAREMWHEVVAVTVVSIGIVKFIEPLTAWVRHSFRREPHQTETTGTWPFRCAVLVAVAFSSFSHDLLDARIHTNMSDALRFILSMLLVSGGITYAWASGAHCEPMRAGRRGFVSGSLITLALLLLLWTDPTEAAGRLAAAGAEQTSKAVGALTVPLIIGADVTSIYGVAIPLAMWAVFGLVGGLAIDRRWRNGSIFSVVLSVLAAAFIMILLLRWGASVATKEIALGSSAILGWCITLLLFPSADSVLHKASGASQI